MATKIQLRRDTEANWTSNNPRLAPGEIGISTDKSNFKIGDGVKNWASLRYIIAPLGEPSNPDSIAIGTGVISNGEDPSIAIGAGAREEGMGLVIGTNARADSYAVSLGAETKSDNGGISIGYKAKGEDGAINIGAYQILVPENHIQIGTTSHEALKIPAIAGATDGLTLKINSDGTIYAE